MRKSAVANATSPKLRRHTCCRSVGSIQAICDSNFEMSLCCVCTLQLLTHAPALSAWSVPLNSARCAGLGFATAFFDHDAVVPSAGLTIANAAGGGRCLTHGAPGDAAMVTTKCDPAGKSQHFTFAGESLLGTHLAPLSARLRFSVLAQVLHQVPLTQNIADLRLTSHHVHIRLHRGQSASMNSRVLHSSRSHASPALA